MATANRDERIQRLESVLELPRPLLKYVRVPFDLPPGPLQTEKLDPELIAKGLIAAKPPKAEGEEEEEEEFVPWDERPPVLAEKLRLLFDATYPEVSDVNTQAVWAAGEVLQLRQLQHLRHDQGPDQAGGADLPPPAAADPPHGGVRATHAAGRRGGRRGRRS